MTYHVRFHWDKWEVVREPDNRLMRRCNSIDEADHYAVQLSRYEDLIARLGEVPALGSVPMGFPEVEGAAA